MRVLEDEQQLCPCYKECQEFQKLVELKESGLLVYCHRPRKDDIIQAEAVASAVNTTKDVFILYNKNDVKITSSELKSELEMKNISCPRCRKKFEHAQKLMQEVKSIDRKIVMGICDHCLKKARTKTRNTAKTFKKPFCACDEIVKKFINVKGEQKEDIKKYVKIWLSKMRHLLKDDIKLHKSQQILSRAYSELQTDQGLNSHASRHEPKIQQMFFSGTHKSDINLNREMRETNLKEGQMKAVAFFQPIEHVETTFAPIAHESERINALIPSTTLEDSDSNFVETHVKQLPKTSLKDRKHEEVFEDTPSMDAKEALKRRHDRSLRQMMRLEKDSGVPYTLPKRPDVYETPKIAPWAQKEPTWKYYVESEIKFKKLEERYITDEEFKLQRSVDKISLKAKKSDQTVEKPKTWHKKSLEPKESVGFVLKPQYSFFFPKVVETEEEQVKLVVSSSHLIKETQEKFRLQAERDTKRRDDEYQQKLDQDQKIKLAREEKKLQAEEERKLDEHDLEAQKRQQDKAKSDKTKYQISEQTSKISTPEQGDQIDKLVQKVIEDLKFKPEQRDKIDEVLQKAKEDVNGKSELKDKGADDDEVSDTGKKDLKGKPTLKSDDDDMEHQKKKRKTRDKDDETTEKDEKGLKGKLESIEKGNKEQKDEKSVSEKSKAKPFIPSEIDLSTVQEFMKNAEKEESAKKEETFVIKQKEKKGKRRKEKESKVKPSKQEAEFQKFQVKHNERETRFKQQPTKKGEDLWKEIKSPKRKRDSSEELKVSLPKIQKKMKIADTEEFANKEGTFVIKQKEKKVKGGKEKESKVKPSKQEAEFQKFQVKHNEGETRFKQQPTKKGEDLSKEIKSPKKKRDPSEELKVSLPKIQKKMKIADIDEFANKEATFVIKQKEKKVKGGKEKESKVKPSKQEAEFQKFQVKHNEGETRFKQQPTKKGEDLSKEIKSPKKKRDSSEELKVSLPKIQKKMKIADIDEFANKEETFVIKQKEKKIKGRKEKESKVKPSKQEAEFQKFQVKHNEGETRFKQQPTKKGEDLSKEIKSPKKKRDSSEELKVSLPKIQKKMKIADIDEFANKEETFVIKQKEKKVKGGKEKESKVKPSQQEAEFQKFQVKHNEGETRFKQQPTKKGEDLSKEIKSPKKKRDISEELKVSLSKIQKKMKIADIDEFANKEETFVIKQKEKKVKGGKQKESKVKPSKQEAEFQQFQVKHNEGETRFKQQPTKKGEDLSKEIKSPKKKRDISEELKVSLSKIQKKMKIADIDEFANKEETFVIKQKEKKVKGGKQKESKVQPSKQEAEFQQFQVKHNEGETRFKQQPTKKGEDLSKEIKSPKKKRDSSEELKVSLSKIQKRMKIADTDEFANKEETFVIKQEKKKVKEVKQKKSKVKPSKQEAEFQQFQVKHNEGETRFKQQPTKKGEDLSKEIKSPKKKRDSSEELKVSLSKIQKRMKIADTDEFANKEETFVIKQEKKKVKEGKQKESKVKPSKQEAEFQKFQVKHNEGETRFKQQPTKKGEDLSKEIKSPKKKRDSSEELKVSLSKIQKKMKIADIDEFANKEQTFVIKQEEKKVKEVKQKESKVKPSKQEAEFQKFQVKLNEGETRFKQEPTKKGEDLSKEIKSPKKKRDSSEELKVSLSIIQQKMKIADIDEFANKEQTFVIKQEEKKVKEVKEKESKVKPSKQEAEFQKFQVKLNEGETRFKQQPTKKGEDLSKEIKSPKKKRDSSEELKVSLSIIQQKMKIADIDEFANKEQTFVIKQEEKKVKEVKEKESKVKPSKQEAEFQKFQVKLNEGETRFKQQPTKKVEDLSKEIKSPKKERDSSEELKVSFSKIQKNMINADIEESADKQVIFVIKHEEKKEKEGTQKEFKVKPSAEEAEFKKLQAKHLKAKEEAFKKKKQLENEAEIAKPVELKISDINIQSELSEAEQIIKFVRIKKDATIKPFEIDYELIKEHKCTHGIGQLNLLCPLCLNSELELDVLSFDKKMKHPEEIITNIIIGEKIFKIKRRRLEKTKEPEVVPKLFRQILFVESDLPPKQMVKIIPQEVESVQKTFLSKKDLKKIEMEPGKGILRYALSDRTFIEKGWTMLPTEKVVRKMNVYRMRPAHPEFDWFEHNKNKRLMTYDTGEKLAEFDDNGRGRWYYRNGRLALDYYDAEETNAQQRFVIYSSGEPDERGRTHPITILATFDYLGNGIVFDHSGKIRLKYNQTEGVVLDRGIGPVSHWKWHTLNDPPVLQQVMIDTQMAHKDPYILKLGSAADKTTRPDNEEMLAIEFDNFIKEKSKKLSQKFKPFQIKMKALKINEHFSLKVLDQATVYLIFRDGSTNLKLNIGMILDHQEIVDTDTAEVGEVSNNLERFPARTDSLAGLQRSVAHAQRYERQQIERERRLRRPEPCASADHLTTAASPPLRLPLRTVPTAPSSSTGYCCRKPINNLYYNTRLL